MQKAATGAGQIVVSCCHTDGYMAVSFLNLRNRKGALLRSYASGQHRRPSAFTPCKVFRVVEQT